MEKKQKRIYQRYLTYSIRSERTNQQLPKNLNFVDAGWQYCQAIEVANLKDI